MLNKQNVFTILLLLFVTVTAAAEDSIKLRGCRRGKINTTAVNRRASSLLRQTRAVSENPFIGDRHQLVVLAAFKDRAFEGDSAATMQKWQKILNQKDFNEASYVGSVHDYFYDQSYGKFNLTFDIQYVQLNDSCSKYASTSFDDENSQFLVQDVVDKLLGRSLNWSLYDWNVDGYVNQLLIIYAGKGMNDGGGNNSIWPHQWWLSSHIIPGTQEYCSPLTVTCEGKEYKVDTYCAVQEKGGEHNPFGTICHEYSHCFGFPDFYNGGTCYVYGWDLMDYGNYSGDGYCPTGYSAHERMLLGWLTPTVLTDETNITDMPALSESNMAYVIRNDAYTDEFYMIENRQQQKWDTYLPNSGIVVFHIDYDADVWGTAYPNSSSKQRYIVIPANNKSFSHYTKYNYNTAMWAYPYNDNNQLTNTSSPAATLWNANTDDSYLMNKSITDMTITDGKASFKFSPTPTAIREIKYDSQTEDVYYNITGQRISGPQKGVYILNGKKYINY